MSIKLAYVTTARSDYTPSYWLIHDLLEDPRFDTQLVVGGSHLSARHGMTVREIETDGWPIAARVPFLDDDNTEAGYGRAAGRALSAFSDLWDKIKPEVVVLYGDRYELLAAASAAVITRTPIAHLCGGDLTGGAIDEQVRHSVTKMAHFHFPSTLKSAKRILQMGEEPWRVHAVGDPGLDHFLRADRPTKIELEKTLGFIPDRETLLVTFHPATLELEEMPRQARELAAALRNYRGSVVITAPAPDPGSEPIRAELKALAGQRKWTAFVENLGSRRYRGLLHLVGAMVGNSSSGLSEAPCLGLPVVNIGRRQEGRERAGNVLDAAPQQAEIEKAIERALSPSFRESLASLESPYGDGKAVPRILELLGNLPERDRLIHKRFNVLPN